MLIFAMLSVQFLFLFIIIHNPKFIQPLTRLQLGLSHFRDHKFKHNFLDAINPLCTCICEIASTVHSFLHCHNHFTLSQTLREINNIDPSILNNLAEIIFKILFYRDSKFCDDRNLKYGIGIGILYLYLKYVNLMVHCSVHMTCQFMGLCICIF